jgi:hypothetical protein
MKPRVSVICPTTSDRRGFLAGAVRCFSSQRVDFQIELLILDEGPNGVECETLAAWPGNVTYRLISGRAARMTVGEKRNILCGDAHGEIIVHFDDDDWSHPDRIAQQVAFLVSSGKQVVGYHDLFYFKVSDRSFWKYHYQGLPCVYASGTSQCYYRSWWEKHPFKKKIVGEDSDFAFEARDAGELASMPDPGMIVVRTHGRNTWMPTFGDKPFLKAERSEFPKEFLAQEGA